MVWQPWIWKHPDPVFKKTTDIHAIHSQPHYYCWHQCWHQTISRNYSSAILSFSCYSPTSPDQAHNFCLTVHLLGSSETADYSWDLWIKHNNKMTFPHPVWMSWWLIPSNAASPPWHRASHPATPPLPSDTTESSWAQSSSAAMVMRRRARDWK